MKKNKSEKIRIDEMQSFDEPNDAQNEDDSLSEEELSLLRESISAADVDRSALPPHDQRGIAHLIRFIRSNAVLSVAAVIIAAAIVISAIGGSAFLTVKIVRDMMVYTVTIGEDEPYTVSPDEMVLGEVMYIDMRKIATHMGLTVSGSPTKIQFTSLKNGTYLLFENESSYVYINGGRTEIKATTVDGKRVVTAKAYVSEDACLVPVTFLEKAVATDTLSFTFDKSSKALYVRPKYFVYDNDVENKVMKELKFITDNFDVTIPEGQRPTYAYSYAIDVTPYLSSIDTEYLMLVNKQNSAGKFKPENLKALDCPTTRSNLSLDYDAAVALEAMMLEMKTAGIEDTLVTSAYRSYEYQEKLYWGYVDDEMASDPNITKEEAERRASEYSARPGESEHQTGLCFDFITKDMGGKLDERFADTDAFAWLSKNAYKYGFILRYPKDDVEVTGYKYEPWHYRFVGRQAASEIYFSGMCLEEYLAGQ